MRMSWSKWWPRGRRKEGTRAANPVSPLSDGETVMLAWVSADGDAHCESVRLDSRGDREIAVRLGQTIGTDTPVWLISADGFERAGSVVACDVQQDRLIGHITLRDATPAAKSPQDAASRIQWVEPGGERVDCAASLAGTGEGRVRVSLPRALPASTVVRIAAREYQCLAAAKSCEPEGEGWVADVEVISPALRMHRSEAA